MAEDGSGKIVATVKEKDTSKFTPNKVNPEQKEFILQQLAEGYKHEQVRQRLNEEHGLEVSIQTIKRYSSLEEERILEKRRALQGQLDRLTSSSKFIRLRELEEQRDRLRVEGYIEPKASERLLMDNSALRRTEVEGFKGSLSLDGDNPFEALASKADLQAVNKKLEEIKKKQGTAKMADKETE